MPKLKMKGVICLFACAATLLLCAHNVDGLNRVPKWVHDMRVQRVAELKQQIARASQEPHTAANAVDAMDVARLAEELAFLQSEETRLQDDKRSIALFATVIMVVLFLMFFLTTAHMEEAIKDA
ncbi:transmembrane protein, partial [Cystoisospora suis]